MILEAAVVVGIITWIGDKIYQEKIRNIDSARKKRDKVAAHIRYIANLLSTVAAKLSNGEIPRTEGNELNKLANSLTDYFESNLNQNTKIEDPLAKSSFILLEGAIKNADDADGLIILGDHEAATNHIEKIERVSGELRGIASQVDGIDIESTQQNH